MIVKALLRNIQEDKEKKFAVITVETQYPLEILTLRLFNIFDRNSAVFKSLLLNIGKEIDLPLKTEIYKGNIQLNFPFGADEFFTLPIKQHKPS